MTNTKIFAFKMLSLFLLIVDLRYILRNFFHKQQSKQCRLKRLLLLKQCHSELQKDIKR